MFSTLSPPTSSTRCYVGIATDDTRERPFNKIVTDEILFFIDIVVNFWMLSFLALLGVVANVLNLAIFFRQGFKNGVNTSLTSIVLWDLLKCLCIITNRLEKPVQLVSPHDAESWFNVTIIYVEYMFIIACQVTYVLASYVSVERCLYVSIPFKVRSLFTSTFTLAAISLISVAVSGAELVILFLFKVVYVISPTYNVTVADTIYTTFYQSHGKEVMTYYNVVGTALPLISFIILCVASAVTMYQLRRASSKIKRHTGNSALIPSRKTQHPEAKSETLLAKAKPTSSSTCMSQKEKKVSKMLLVVLFVYIANLFPRQLYYIASLIQPEYGLFKKYHNLFVASSKFLFVFDLINASINVLIFFKMSSNFRATFSQIVPCRRSQG